MKIFVRFDWYLSADQISVSKKIKFLAGGRLDIFNQETIDFAEDITIEQSSERFSPRVGIVYQPIEPISSIR